VLLSKQRDRMSGALTNRLGNGRRRAREFKSRLDEGASVEDDDELQAADSGPGSAS